MGKINKDLLFSPETPTTWPALLTIAQTAKILNLSKWTLRLWDNNGKLKAIRIGTRKDRRYQKAEVLKIFTGV